MRLKKKLYELIRNRFFLNEINSYRNELDTLKKEAVEFVKPGHYYSAVHDLNALPENIAIDYNQPLDDIDLNERGQLDLLNSLKQYYNEDLFPISKEVGKRYYFDNDFFGYSDGLFLNAMMREFKPKRIVEIGSGFSSALMLDISERFLSGSVNLEFIEPYPEERLMTLIKNNENCTITKTFVQNTANATWELLDANDLLFIDSSHVSKFNSDVNYLIFNVFPKLKSGVIIHIHDIFFPFEYPVEWLQQGRSWSEAYLIRAFLQNNNDYEIILYSSFLEGKYHDWFESNMPLCLKVHKRIVVDGKESFITTNGQSIYIRKK